MRLPYIAIGINDSHQLTIAHIRQIGEVDPHKIELPLHELNADGLDVAIKRVGEWTLGTLSHWYPDEWSRFPHLKFPLSAQPDLDLIADLINKSSASKTKAHIPSIQLLIDEVIAADPSLAEQGVIKTWPDVRSYLEKYPG